MSTTIYVAKCVLYFCGVEHKCLSSIIHIQSCRSLGSHPYEMVKANSINLSMFLIKPFSHVNSQNGPERTALLRQGLRSQRTRANVCCVRISATATRSHHLRRDLSKKHWGNSGIYGENMSTLQMKGSS